MQKSFFKNLSYLTLIQISNTLVPLLVIPYITKIISPDNFGSLEFSRVYCYYFTIAINYGFDLTATRQISIHRENVGKVNEIVSQTFYAKIILLIISSIIFLISLASIPSLQDIFTLLILTYIINIGYTLYPVWFFQGKEKLAFISVINFFIKLFIAILTLLFIRENYQYWVYNFLQSLSLIIVGFISIYFLYSKFGFKLEKFNKRLIFTIFKEGFPIFMGTILVTVMTSLFFLFLKVYSTEIELAKFSTSNKIISTLQGLILLPFSQAFFPLIAKQANENHIEFKKSIKKASFILFLITFMAGIFTIFFGELIITIIFSEKYLTALSSLKVLAFLPMFSTMSNIFAYQGLLSLKKDTIFLRIHIVYSILTLIFSFIMISGYNALIASWIRIIIEAMLFLTALLFYIITCKKENL